MVFMRNMVKEIILHMSLITKVMFYKLLLVKKNDRKSKFEYLSRCRSSLQWYFIFFTKLYTHLSLNEKFLLGNTTRNRLPGMI